MIGGGGTDQPVPAVADLRLVPAALAVWAVTVAGILGGPLPAAAVVVAATFATAVSARVLGGTGASPWPAAAMVAAAGATFAVAVCLRADAVEHHRINARLGDTVAVSVTATETPRSIAGGRVMFAGELRSLDGVPVGGRVIVFASVGGVGDLTVGRPADFRARVGAPLRRDLTVAVLSATGRARLGEAGLVHRAAAAVRRTFAETARAALPADQAAMLPALVLGDTSAVDRTTLDEFRRAGLTHLTAVSGANVTIVCGTVLLSAVLVGPRCAVALAAVVLVAFVIVVQPTASVLRAAVMGAVTLLAVLAHRRRQAIPALAATVVTVLTGWPHLAVDVGFALSVVATAALVVIAPVWTSRLRDRGWPKPLAAAVSVSTAAQLVTAPLVAGISGTVSFVAIAANLAATVVVAPITVLGTAAAAVATAWPGGAALLVRFTGPELWWLLWVAGRAAAIPGAVLPVPSGLAGAVCVAATSLAAVAAWRWRWGRVLVVWTAVGAAAWAASAHVGTA